LTNEAGYLLIMANIILIFDKGEIQAATLAEN
jgi:hypothetical protein